MLSTQAMAVVGAGRHRAAGYQVKPVLYDGLQFIIGTLTCVVMVCISMVVSSNSSDTPNNLKLK